ncbi:ARM10-like protein [Mya arenaria]|uniref:ARM10-like protein n=1 Tax=Mya arenaria TaxID=6604 RepID=A0ABY7FVX3_MYAAR|nr:ARM10-like protein [Mya arenaria]
MASILTFCYSVFINIDGKLNQIAKNKISSFESTNTWEDVLSDFMNKANVTLQKTDSVTISVCKNSTDVESFHPDISESISVLNTFDCSIKERYDYTCGSVIVPEGDSLEGVVSVRLQMDCSTPIKFPYYAGNNPVAVRKDICCHCGEGGTERDAALLQKYKTVLPVCRACKLIKDIPKRNPIKVVNIPKPKNKQKQTPKSQKKQEDEQKPGTSKDPNGTVSTTAVKLSESFVVPSDDDCGSPIPDKEGLTVSASWAILNSSNQSSPQLSPIGEVTVEYEELLREHRESESQQFTAEEITEALTATQTPESGLTERNAEVLTGLLTYDDIHLKHAAVQGIANSAAFTKNQITLREAEVLPRLSKLLELQRMSLWLRHAGSDTATCVPTLVDISLDADTGLATRLSSLQALTNLSAEGEHHGHYTRLVQQLYTLLTKSWDPALRLQGLKILVNLSCNPDMVPHLLAAKAPEGLLTLLDPAKTDEGLILRFITFLDNVVQVKQDRHITPSSLPSTDKAASPETMYSALLGLGNVADLKNKVFLLFKHTNNEVRQHANRIYNSLK